MQNEKSSKSSAKITFKIEYIQLETVKEEKVNIYICLNKGK